MPPQILIHPNVLWPGFVEWWALQHVSEMIATDQQQLSNTDVKIVEREDKTDGGLPHTDRTETGASLMSWSYQWNCEKQICFLPVWFGCTQARINANRRHSAAAASHRRWSSSCSTDLGQTCYRDVVSWLSDRHTPGADRRSTPTCIRLNPRKVNSHFSGLKTREISAVYQHSKCSQKWNYQYYKVTEMQVHTLNSSKSGQQYSRCK